MSSAAKKGLFWASWICAGMAAALVIAVAVKNRDTFQPTDNTGLNSALPAADASGRREEVIEIDVLALRTMLQLDPNLYLVDVRSARELDGPLGRIPQAVHIPLRTVMEKPDIFASSKTLVFICEAGVRSMMAAKAVASQGRVAYSVKGGMTAWRELESLKSDSSPAEKPGPAPENKRPSGRDGDDSKEFFEQDMGC
jgi:rhodanese-related sulfurtransferase